MYMYTYINIYTRIREYYFIYFLLRRERKNKATIDVFVFFSHLVRRSDCLLVKPVCPNRPSTPTLCRTFRTRLPRTSDRGYTTRWIRKCIPNKPRTPVRISAVAAVAVVVGKTVEDLKFNSRTNY